MPERSLSNDDGKDIASKKRRRMENCSSSADISEIPPLLENLQNEMLFSIISFLHDGDVDNGANAENFTFFWKGLVSSFGLASKRCYELCIHFVQRTPMSVSLAMNMMHTHAELGIQEIRFWMWLIQTRVKIGHLRLKWSQTLTHTGTIALSLVRKLAMSCDFTDLRTLRILNGTNANVNSKWERIKSKDERRLILNGIAAGLHSSLLDDYYALYSAIAENAKGIEVMELIITKEIFHRPILSNFSNSLKVLKLYIHSLTSTTPDQHHLCNCSSPCPHLEEICDMISEMPNLKRLVLESAVNVNVDADVSMPADNITICIRSEPLEQLEPGNFDLESCVCPSLVDLFCRHESSLTMRGDLEDNHEVVYDSCRGDIYKFAAGKSGVKLIGIEVPEDCIIRIAADPNWSDDSSDYDDDDDD